MIDPQKLAEVHLFRGMKPEYLEVLVKNLRPLHIDAGENVVTEGISTRGPLFIVTEGKMEVSRKDADGNARTLAVLEPPTVIGEMEFLAEIESSATVTAKADIEGYLLPRALFEKLFDRGEAAAYHLALSIGRVMSERLAETNKLLTRALAKDPERLEKVQKLQLDPEGLKKIDAELDALLEL